MMKLIFLGSSFSIVWYIRRHKLVRRSYDKDQDTFRHVFLVLPCLILALLIHEKFTFLEVTMSFHLIIMKCFSTCNIFPGFKVLSDRNTCLLYLQTCMCLWMQEIDQGYDILFDHICTLIYLEIFACRYCGHSPCIWKQLQYCLNLYCCKEQEILTTWQDNMSSF